MPILSKDAVPIYLAEAYGHDLSPQDRRNAYPHSSPFDYLHTIVSVD